MFQDEARFGRLSNPMRCWAPRPVRPLVQLALIREYSYAYAAISPLDGGVDWMMAPKMDTVTMGGFLNHVSCKHPDEFVVMVVDGAPSHRSGKLNVPKNVALLFLPPYSPELNPVEHLWDELREKWFGNRVFDSLGAAMVQAMHGLKDYEESPERIQSLTAWDWIIASL